MQTAELRSLMSTLAPRKVFGAHHEGAAYEVAIQNLHWSEPGSITLRSGRHCLIELAEPAAPTLAPGVASTRYFIDGADGQALPTGRLNFMPPDATHNVRWSAGGHHAVVCVMEPERLGLLGSIDWHWGDIDPARTVDVRNDKLRIGMEWLADEIRSPSFASGLKVSSLLTMLAIDLHRHCGGTTRERAAPPGKLDARQLSLLKELVEGASDPSQLSLAAMAANCRLPARELSTMFKHTVGQTLRSYVAATHIARAKVLLDDADLLIKQVAYRSGFRSAAAFGDAFRRATGMTPVQYRLSRGVVGGEVVPNLLQ